MKNMNKLNSREILSIFVPGAYIVLFSNLILIQDKTDAINPIVLNVLLEFTLSLLVGLVIYIIDLPKRVWFFNNNRPTEIINKELGEISYSKIENAFFLYYDNHVSDKQKDKTERLTSFYNFSINIFSSSLIILFLFYINTESYILLKYYFNINGLILIISIISSIGLFFGKRKIKYIFNRQYKSFKDSEEYNKLSSKYHD